MQLREAISPANVKMATGQTWEGQGGLGRNDGFKVKMAIKMRLK